MIHSHIDPAVDRKLMAIAIEEAHKAAKTGEIPVGAVLIQGDQLIARAHNRRELDQSPISHAEILVLEQGAKKLNRWRLGDCTLYVTLEPCPMCAGAIVMARLGRLVYGAPDHKSGAVESLFNIPSHPCLNHQVATTSMVEETACREILQNFFHQQRQSPP